ncbi:hypothetical protein LZD49_02825 [Dyadobacter sp. CY261]|uniref:hypothetical protein n=1 Tax=Dyadobacter sp. CY261 TaxID=2907203 RepID=UPI001F423C22|nr:hypothetical protein [Dyadobacter sp. CY261]MCF0069386.1 hypothetical protein [Dyadobacter sp. CY261]
MSATASGGGDHNSPPNNKKRSFLRKLLTKFILEAKRAAYRLLIDLVVWLRNVVKILTPSVSAILFITAYNYFLHN